ncbi:MAG: hypothetical protein E7574_04095 [Ruminococcaceae bacterium]|nr:hypothetical protein [Oscillospiraceae bacterium]
MIGKICGIICVISFIFGCFTGNLSQLSSAVVDGASNAVTLTITLMGMMCLWSGIMRVAQVSGIIDKFASLMSPVLKFLFPDAYKKKNGLGEIAASISANIFGIGNAATPLAICAMEKLQENNEKKDVATNDMIMFAVLGTASFDIFPTTLIALRRAADSQNPFEIIVPVWICSFLTAVFAVLLVKGFCALKKR